MFFTFDELQTAPLIVDAVYEGGWESRNLADEPLSKIFQGVGSGLGNSGGFRVSGKSSGSGYCVLYTLVMSLIGQTNWICERESLLITVIIGQLGGQSPLKRGIKS